MKLKEIFIDKRKRNVIIKRLLQYILLFNVYVFLCFVCMLSVKSALNIKLNASDIIHSLHLTAYIILTFAIVFFIVFSVVQHFATTIPVRHIRERLYGLREGDFETVLPKENTILDISEFNPIIEDLNITAAELNSMQNLSQDFINNVSHEFKTPLAVIKNYAMLLQNENISFEKKNEYINVIVSSVDDLNSMVSNALMLNRIEHQTIFPNKESCNLSEQVAQAILSFESQIEEKHINLEVELDDDVIVSTEKNLSNHIWLNLLSNAIKFTDVGGEIKVFVKKIDDMAVVSICDNGCGIKEDELDMIFEKYYQASNSSKVKGNGLGLPLVKRLVDVLDMQISVDSKLGSGTAFVVSKDL